MTMRDGRSGKAVTWREIAERIFPAQADNLYRGQPLGYWIFVLLTVQRIAMSATHLLTHDGGAASLSHLPIHSYPTAAAQNVIGLFARLGVAQLGLALAMVIVLVRYRSLIPVILLVLSLEQLVSRFVAESKPLVAATASSVAIPLKLIGSLAWIGLVLALLPVRTKDSSGSSK